MTSSWRRFALVLALPSILAASACTTESEGASEATEDELNYRSTAGQEYELSTSVTFAVPADAQSLTGAEREQAITARAEKLRTQVLSTISSELERMYPEEARIRNGAVAIQYRQLTPTFRDLTEVDGGAKYSMTVAGEFGAMKDVETKLPLVAGADGKKYLPIRTDLGEGEIELQVSVTPIERSRDAYPKYLELFEGGLDIGFFAGGDHHDPPQDINHARSVYDDLVRSGFRSPVAGFDALKIDSGPLTSKIKVKGADVDVRVRIFHVNMTPENDRSALVAAYQKSMHDDDVVIYDGHAGKRLDYSGVVLAYKPSRVSVTAAQFAQIETTNKQQVYLFNGCETYTGYADKLYENPNRTPDNTDIITTVNYSAIQRQANQVIAFIHQLIDQKNGQWVPRSWDSVLSRMNAVGERSWFHGYGVHGLDENGRVSPIADLSKVGQACTSDAQCGSADAKCVQTSSTRRVCGVACADSSGCPSGTKCVLPRGLTSLDDRQCLPN